MLEISLNRNRFWRNNKGELHRVNGPAIEWKNGIKEWYINDELHRIDGPAVEYVNGTRCWFINNKKHRGDGPAIEYPNGDKRWFLNGKEYSEAEYREKVKEYVRDR